MGLEDGVLISRGQGEASDGGAVEPVQVGGGQEEGFGDENLPELADPAAVVAAGVGGVEQVTKAVLGVLVRVDAEAERCVVV